MKIIFDDTHLPLSPSFVLANRNGNKLGYIPAVNINFGDHLESASELQFRVYKKENDIECKLWDDIIDLKLVWCPEWDKWFEIKVDISDSNSVVKDITATSLGEAELSQTNLYGIEINTETDIQRDDYVVTVLYDPTDPKGSLLDRITEKVPHYKIGHVDDSIANIQRIFTFDGISILDALYEIGEEIDCLFIIDTGSDSNGGILRTINAYDLESVCLSCGHRGIFSGSCPECDSNDVYYGYGQDTNIYVSKENLTDEITYSSNTDSVKNCFRLVGGDDLMTATIMNCNPNGSNYLWYFSDEMKRDMSDELRQRLEEYENDYAYYSSKHPFELPNENLVAYNALVEKYRVFRETLKTVSNPIIGYSSLMNLYYDLVDFEMYLKHELMPSVEISGTTAELEAAKLTEAALSPTAVTNLVSCSTATASSAVLAVAKQIVRSNYQVKVNHGILTDNMWTGNFVVTNYADEDDTATSETVYITITDEMQVYLSQRINRILSDKSDEIYEITDLFALDIGRFKAEIKKYCLASLNSFRDICQSCMDILIEQGVADKKAWSGLNPNLYTAMYIPYYDKMNALIAEVELRESEIAIIEGVYDENGGVVEIGLESIVDIINEQVQSVLNFESYLGANLTNQLAAYRREDTYENSNFISDGLSNQEIFDSALDFINLAKQEIYKSAMLQHTITSTLKNLLVMKEFLPLVDSFEIGNWLTIRVAGNLYRLRLISYEIDFDNLDCINVEFSDVVETVFGRNDVESILKSASSISSSFSSVQRQASRGNQTSKQLDGYKENGLPLTQVKIVDDGESQNVTMDHHGLLCRKLDPFTGQYGDRQLKIINEGLYLTDDGWESSRAGIGLFRYYDPSDKTWKTDYGVVANTLIGHLLLSENVGIYNEDGSISLNNNGFTLISNSNGDNKTVFRIQRKVTDGDEETIEDVIYFDDRGNANFNGIINASAVISDRSVADLLTEIDATVTQISVQYAQNHSSSTAPQSGWGSSVPVWKAGYYIWQRFVLTSESGTTYTTPACVSGLDGQSVTVSNVQYSVGTSGTSAPTTDWQSTIPYVAQGKWLWCKVTFSDSTEVLSSTYYAIDGTNGQDGKSVSIQSATKTDGVTTVVILDSDGSTKTLSIADGEDGNDGIDGIDGLNQATIYLFQRSSTEPSSPNADTTYTFSTGVLSPVPTDWSRSIPSGADPCWVVTASPISPQASCSISSESWSSVTKLVEDGTDGTSVTISSVEYAVGTSGTTVPTTGWQTSIPTVDQGKWLWCKTTYSNGSIATICTYIGKDGVLMDGYEVVTIEEIEEILQV